MMTGLVITAATRGRKDIVEILLDKSTSPVSDTSDALKFMFNNVAELRDETPSAEVGTLLLKRGANH